MKKSLVNTAVAIALSGAIFSGTVLASETNVEVAPSVTTAITDNNTSIYNTTETYLYPGMGVGAATGTLIGGPVGFVIGGLIGAFVGANKTVSSSSTGALAMADNTATDAITETTAVTKSKAAFNDNHKNMPAKYETASIQLAQIGATPVITDEKIHSQSASILDILTSNLSLDIYFRSGSSSIESFYPARLKAIAKLMTTMDKLELHLDGYSDRRGNKMKNMALSNERINNVRKLLIKAGVDPTRIISKAFGEMKMVSAPGDLEAYTFDRKVVIRFQRSTADSIHAMTQQLSEIKSSKDLTLSSNHETVIESIASETMAVEAVTRF